MNKQEQIDKIRENLKTEIVIYKETLIDFDTTAKNLLTKGYINGADFVEWLKNRVISNKYYPHLAVTLLCDDTREELSEFIDKALQEYLKGE